MRLTLITPGKVFAAACVFSATNLLMSADTSHDFPAFKEYDQSLFQGVIGVGVTEAATKQAQYSQLEIGSESVYYHF